jgi:hypothetical protein
MSMTKKRKDATYVAGPHKVKDSRDYYTKLWDAATGRGAKDPIVGVWVRPGGRALVLDEWVLEVQVHSEVLRGRIKMGEMAISRFDPTADVRMKACTLAGALAEQACATFGDTFDPSIVAKAGGEAFDKWLADRERTGGLTRATLKS